MLFGSEVIPHHRKVKRCANLNAMQGLDLRAYQVELQARVLHPYFSRIVQKPVMTLAKTAIEFTCPICAVSAKSIASNAAPTFSQVRDV